jgi:hypothetical protein
MELNWPGMESKGTSMWSTPLIVLGLTATTLIAACDLDDRSIDMRERSAPTSKDPSSPSSPMSSQNAVEIPRRAPTGLREGGTPEDAGASGHDADAPQLDARGEGQRETGGRGGAAGGGAAGGAGDAQPPQGGEPAVVPNDEDSGVPDGGGGAGADAAPCTAGNELVPIDGWVDRTKNCVGVQGGVWADFPLDPHEYDFVIIVTHQTNAICLEGFQGAPLDVSVGLYLNQEPRNGPNPVLANYDAEAHAVVGVEFVVGGPELMPYFGVLSEDTIYCTPITDPGHYRVAWTDLHAECWNGTAGPTPDPTKLTSIAFFGGATVDTLVSFNYCIEDIVALTALE